MKDLLPILIGLVVAFVVFVLLWRKGAFLKLSAYIDETKEELRKCTWPTWTELWDSTKLVMVAIALLGAFTVVADVVFAFLVKAIVA
ncbi:MAG: Protein translocase subunit SecE [Verrucomicrobiales bacterium]|nr:Protein translocase subunit SecE [Verrucomicrobiales bacterium]